MWEDPEEREEISKKYPEVTKDLLSSFNLHWKDHPTQFDWATSVSEYQLFEHIYYTSHETCLMFSVHKSVLIRRDS